MVENSWFTVQCTMYIVYMYASGCCIHRRLLFVNFLHFLIRPVSFSSPSSSSDFSGLIQHVVQSFSSNLPDTIKIYDSKLIFYTFAILICLHTYMLTNFAKKGEFLCKEILAVDENFEKKEELKCVCLYIGWAKTICFVNLYVHMISHLFLTSMYLVEVCSMYNVYIQKTYA